jgi:undecaprenyl-diphosphatase
VIDFDQIARAWIVAHRLRVSTAPMAALSTFGRGGVGWLVIGAALAAAGKLTVRTFLQLAASILLTTIVSDHIVKPWVGRARPFVTTPQVEVIGHPPGDASFPSGHSANAFASALVLARSIPRWKFAWWALAATIAYSRVYLGVHYPLDVAGGALIGLACSALIAVAIERRRVSVAGRRQAKRC